MPQTMRGEKLQARATFALGWFCSIVLHTALEIYSLTYASAALLAPFAGTHILANIWLASVINNEVLSRRGKWACLAVVAGIIGNIAVLPKVADSYPVRCVLRDPNTL